jgi:hypothetical protein
MPEVPFIVEQKKLEDYEVLKESSAEVRLLVEIYERRIAELNAVIEKLIGTREIVVPHIPRVVGEPSALPINKNKIATTSQLVAEMEKRTRIGEKK